MAQHLGQHFGSNAGDAFDPGQDQCNSSQQPPVWRA
jgi:hypothetical protein